MNDFSPTQCMAARSLLRITQGDLCTLANVAIKTLSDFEAGKSKPYADTVKRICAALEKQGIVFISDGEVSQAGGVGVRLKDSSA